MKKIMTIAVLILFILVFSGCEDKKEDFKGLHTFTEEEIDKQQKRRLKQLDKAKLEEFYSPMESDKKQKEKSVEDWKKGKEQRLKDMDIKIKNAEKMYKKRVL